MEQNRDSCFTAYDSASEIPILLRRLLSKDLEDRSQALSELYNNVLHQESRFAAVTHILPFIIELCAEPSVPNRNRLLWFWGFSITSYFSVR